MVLAYETFARLLLIKRVVMDYWFEETVLPCNLK